MHSRRTISQLFAPALVLPAQFGHSPRGLRATGERALMFAVLEDAIRCLDRTRSNARGANRLARRAEAWIRSRDRAWPFSFLNVCDALDLDPTALRTGLLAPATRIARVGHRLRLRMRAGTPAERVVPPRQRRRQNPSPRSDPPRA